MAFTLASLRVRTLFRTRVRRPAKPWHLQLNELEPRQMPGNVWQGVFLGLAGASMVEPLMAMTEVYGQDGLPEAPLPKAEPTVETATAPTRPAEEIDLSRVPVAVETEESRGAAGADPL